MNWYYESDGLAVGPVEEEVILSLRAEGEVSASVRVRREDWTDWRAATEVWPVMLSSKASHAGSAASRPLIGPCVECGAQDARMTALGNSLVCPACEPMAREKQLQGLPLGTGPWREGPILVMREDLALPNRCVKCAEPATSKLRKRLFWHEPVLYLAIFAGVLPYLVLALTFRRRVTVDLPLCARCAEGRRWSIAKLLVGFLGLAAIFSMVSLSLWRHESVATVWLAAAGLALLIVVVWGWGIQIGVAHKIGDRYARLIKIGEPFLNLLPRWPYD